MQVRYLILLLLFVVSCSTIDVSNIDTELVEAQRELVSLQSSVQALVGSRFDSEFTSVLRHINRAREFLVALQSEIGTSYLPESIKTALGTVINKALQRLK